MGGPTDFPKSLDLLLLLWIQCNDELESTCALNHWADVMHSFFGPPNFMHIFVMCRTLLLVMTWRQSLGLLSHKWCNCQTFFNVTVCCCDITVMRHAPHATEKHACKKNLHRWPTCSWGQCEMVRLALPFKVCTLKWLQSFFSLFVFCRQTPSVMSE